MGQMAGLPIHSPGFGRAPPGDGRAGQLTRWSSTSGRWRQTECGDRTQDFPEQSARHRQLGHLENYGPAVADNLGADLRQPVAQVVPAIRELWMPQPALT